MKIDYTKVKSVLKPKKSQVKDTPRFPKLINPIENDIKSDFAIQINKMIVDITKKMVEIKK